MKTLAANLEQAYPVEQKDQTFLVAPLPRFVTGTKPAGDREAGGLRPSARCCSAWPAPSCSLPL
jgi:hypothetical protein